MACIIWTGTSQPTNLISKLFANEDIEDKGTALKICIPKNIILNEIFFKDQDEYLRSRNKFDFIFRTKKLSCDFSEIIQ